MAAAFTIHHLIIRGSTCSSQQRFIRKSNNRFSLPHVVTQGLSSQQRRQQQQQQQYHHCGGGGVSYSSTFCYSTTTTLSSRRQSSSSFSRMLDMGGAPSGATANKNSNVGVRNTSKNSKVQAVVFDFELLTLSTLAEQQQENEKAVSKRISRQGISSTTAKTGATTTMKTSATIQPDVNRVEEIATLLRTSASSSTTAGSSGGGRRSDNIDDEAHDENEADLAATLLGGTEVVPSQKNHPLSAATTTTTTTTNLHHNDTTKNDSSYNVAKTNSKENSDDKGDDLTLTNNKGKLPASLTDIRPKYANKLRKAGVDGGIAGIELANYQRQEATKKGDAEGHWMARKMALAQKDTTITDDGGSSSSNTRWMALTGTGKLLSTLTYRSMKIALLPRTGGMVSSISSSKTTTTNKTDRTPQERMVDFTRQLKDVRFDVLMDLPSTTTAGNSDSNDTATMAVVDTMLQSARKELDLDTNVILMVSDQDAYLRTAKEMGMLTCRIRPRNARRGNVSAHYTVQSILDVEDVVNDINGISFNVVLNM